LGNNTIRTFRGGLLRLPQETLGEHLAIIEALEKGDGELAEKLIREHTSKSMATLKDKIKK
jgi:DNA-binding GntR family transcriptional regulator